MLLEPLPVSCSGGSQKMEWTKCSWNGLFKRFSFILKFVVALLFVPLVNAPMVAEKVFEKNCRGIFGMGLGGLSSSSHLLLVIVVVIIVIVVVILVVVIVVPPVLIYPKPIAHHLWGFKTRAGLECSNLEDLILYLNAVWSRQVWMIL